MKKLIIIGAVALFAFSSEKSYKMNLTEGQVQILYSTLQASRIAVQASSLPMNEGVQIIKGIDSISKVIAIQYQAQMDTTKKTK